MKTSELKSGRGVVEQVILEGFRVYMRTPDDTWAIYTNQDGSKIACIEWGRESSLRHGGSPSLATVHRPNKTTGTGFTLGPISAITAESLARAFRAPDWATANQHRASVPYTGINDFTATGWNVEYKEVELNKDTLRYPGPTVADLESAVAAIMELVERTDDAIQTTAGPDVDAMWMHRSLLEEAAEYLVREYGIVGRT